MKAKGRKVGKGEKQRIHPQASHIFPGKQLWLSCSGCVWRSRLGTWSQQGLEGRHHQHPSVGPSRVPQCFGHHSPQEVGPPPHLGVVMLLQTRASGVRLMGWAIPPLQACWCCTYRSSLCPEGRTDSRTLGQRNSGRCSWGDSGRKQGNGWRWWQHVRGARQIWVGTKIGGLG